MNGAERLSVTSGTSVLAKYPSTFEAWTLFGGLLRAFLFLRDLGRRNRSLRTNSYGRASA